MEIKRKSSCTSDEEFLSFRSSLVSSFVRSSSTRGLYPHVALPFSPVTLHNIGFLCQAHHLIIDRITSTFLGDFSFRIGHTSSSGEYICMARRLLLFLSFTTYSRSSPFIIAQAGVEASLRSRSFSIYIPLIYLFSCLSAS